MNLWEKNIPAEKQPSLCVRELDAANAKTGNTKYSNNWRKNGNNWIVNSIQEVRIRVKKFFKKEKGKIKITKITNMKTKTKNSKIYF